MPAKKKPAKIKTDALIVVAAMRHTETARHALLHPIHEMDARQLVVAHLEKTKEAIESAIIWASMEDDELAPFTLFEIESIQTNLDTAMRHVGHVGGVLSDSVPEAEQIEARRKRRERSERDASRKNEA
jgi:hypothetical protein